MVHVLNLRLFCCFVFLLALENISFAMEGSSSSLISPVTSATEEQPPKSLKDIGKLFFSEKDKTFKAKNFNQFPRLRQATSLLGMLSSVCLLGSGVWSKNPKRAIAASVALTTSFLSLSPIEAKKLSLLFSDSDFFHARCENFWIERKHRPLIFCFSLPVACAVFSVSGELVFRLFNKNYVPNSFRRNFFFAGGFAALGLATSDWLYKFGIVAAAHSNGLELFTPREVRLMITDEKWVNRFREMVPIRMPKEKPAVSFCVNGENKPILFELNDKQQENSDVELTVADVKRLETLHEECYQLYTPRILRPVNALKERLSSQSNKKIVYPDFLKLFYIDFYRKVFTCTNPNDKNENFSFPDEVILHILSFCEFTTLDNGTGNPKLVTLKDVLTDETIRKKAIEKQKIRMPISKLVKFRLTDYAWTSVINNEESFYDHYIVEEDEED